MSKSKNLVHGIDITAPGGIEMLLDFHRGTFGNATMQADAAEATTDAESTEAVTAVDNPDASTEAASSEEVTEDKVTDWKAEAEKWKTLSRKNEDKAKTNHTKLTELELRLTQFESESNDFKKLKEDYTTLLKKSVATEIGLPTELIDRLRGSTEEELKADAETFKALLPVTKKTVQPVTKQGTDTDIDLGPKKFKSAQEQLKAIKNNKN